MITKWDARHWQHKAFRDKKQHTPLNILSFDVSGCHVAREEGIKFAQAIGASTSHGVVAARLEKRLGNVMQKLLAKFRSDRLKIRK